MAALVDDAVLARLNVAAGFLELKALIKKTVAELAGARLRTIAVRSTVIDGVELRQSGAHLGRHVLTRSGRPHCVLSA